MHAKFLKYKVFIEKKYETKIENEGEKRQDYISWA